MSDDGKIHLRWLWVEISFPKQYPFQPFRFRVLNVRGNPRLDSKIASGPSINSDGHPLVTDFGSVYTSKAYQHQWHPAFQIQDLIADIENSLRDPNSAVERLLESGSCLRDTWVKYMPDYSRLDWEVNVREAQLKSKLTELNDKSLSLSNTPHTMIFPPEGGYKMFGEVENAKGEVSVVGNVSLNKQLVAVMERDLPGLRMLYTTIFKFVDLSKSAAAEKAVTAFSRWSCASGHSAVSSSGTGLNRGSGTGLDRGLVGELG